MRLAHCIGCGCHDLAACCDEHTGSPCSWLAVDRTAGLGVCSACADHLTRWEAGERSHTAKALTAIQSDESLPRYGQIWQYKGAQVCILGNFIDDDGSIWAADWATGKRIDPSVMELVPIAITETDTFDAVTEKCTEWARAGNHNAAWWLGWRWEGVNHPKSIWYYVAAMRLNPRGYSWALDRIQSDALFGGMCAGTPQPDIAFIKRIPELVNGAIGKAWRDAIDQAEVAVHLPATPEQLLAALEHVKSGFRPREAAYKADVTAQFLTTSAEYRAWSNAESELQSRRDEAYWAGFRSLDNADSPQECKYACDTMESKWWREGQDAAKESLADDEVMTKG